MSLNNRSILFLKGMAMGISDLIPGISGGTIALLLGIYKDFISSLKSINYKSFIYLVRLDFKKLNNHIRNNPKDIYALTEDINYLSFDMG